MSIQFKETLLRASLLGGICNWLISPSHGMELEVNNSQDANVHIAQQRKTPSKEDIKCLQKNYNLLTTQDIEQWISYAGTGDLASLYHLGCLVAQKEKAKHPIIDSEKSPVLILEKAKAFYWSERAKNKDDLEAWFEVGMLYEQGTGVEKSYATAHSYYEKARDKGFCHYYGRGGVPIDFQNALKCLEGAETRGYREKWLFRALGLIYYHGRGISQDHKKAFAFFQKGAEEKDICSQYNLGVMYINGQGVEKDYTKAFEWFSKVPEELTGTEFFSCDLTDDDASQVASLLSRAKHLTKLSLAWNGFTSKGLNDILTVLPPKLEKLDLRYNFIDDEGGTQLLKIIENTPIKRILLNGNPMGMKKEIKQSINKKFLFKMKPKKITGSEFRNCGLAHGDVSSVVNLLQNTQHLTDIDFGKNKLTAEGVKNILSALDSYPHLTQLDFANNPIGNEGVIVLHSFLSKENIESIVYTNSEMEKSIEKSLVFITDPETIDGSEFHDLGITDDDVPQVIPILCKAPSLSKLLLGWNNFTSVFLKQIMPALKVHTNLQELDLRYTSIEKDKEEILVQLAEENTSLIKIHCDIFLDIKNGNEKKYNKISNETNNKLKNILIPRLALVKLSGDEFSSCNLNDDSAGKISELLFKNSQLTEIDLSDNNFTFDGLKIILKGLSSHSDLIELDLSLNPIGNEGELALLDFLRTNNSLQDINLIGTKIDDEIKIKIAHLLHSRNNNKNERTEDLSSLGASASPIACFLSQREDLQRVNLFNNSITSTGLEEILDALQTHTNLTSLNISHNFVDEEGGKALLEFVKKVTALKHIILKGNVKMSKNIITAIKRITERRKEKQTHRQIKESS